MPKELRINAVVAVPDDVLEQAVVIAACKAPIDEFIAALAKAGGVTHEVALVAPREVAAKKGGEAS